MIYDRPFAKVIVDKCSSITFVRDTQQEAVTTAGLYMLEHGAVLIEGQAMIYTIKQTRREF